MTSKISRNDPCPCGSGRKYKKCCLDKDEKTALAERQAVQRAMAAADEYVERLDELSNKSNDLIREQRWAEALAVCRQLAEEFPEEIDADDRLAQLYEAQADYPQALLHARAALNKAQKDRQKFDEQLIEDLEESVAFLQQQTAP